MNRIVYTNENGGVSVVIPAPECPLTLEEIARKDVPSGRNFWIVDASAIPTDRTERDAWTLTDMPEPDGVGA
jgi:hypothetical protein